MLTLVFVSQKKNGEFLSSPRWWMHMCVCMCTFLGFFADNCPQYHSKMGGPIIMIKIRWIGGNVRHPFDVIFLSRLNPPLPIRRSHVEASSPMFSTCLISRELTYPTWGGSEIIGAFTKGIVSSQEDNFVQFLHPKGLPSSYVMDMCMYISISLLAE